ncbi:hypothetical protein [Bacillus solimangrovi]|uniref:Intracellular proteinase inhibitor BsuPI domain-containing protein n=1 Tax=Bacillus solimangrovi TaxID=1305675 RepID=A0A1E5LJ47_9BACI|nr:hypothetical protein [Bacillus solimangrovi]OEH94110.1 hypothetical protein BFG57_09695 [Bacillus solimangrovi]
MRKLILLAFLISLTTIIVVFAINFINQERNTTITLSSELTYNGVSNGYDEYLYTLTNSNLEVATVEFLSNNELTISIRGEAVPTVKTGKRTFEYDKKKKTFKLETGEKVTYKIKVNRDLLLPGDYELRVSLAAKDIETPLQKNKSNEFSIEN